MRTSLPKLSLILGGAASGKSAYAENLIKSHSASKYYIATANVWDAEIEMKVAAHRSARGPDWTTLEAPMDVVHALKSLSAADTVLIDCATMWLSNHLLENSALEAEQLKMLAALNDCPASIVIVSNEVGHGIVPDNALARKFREAQGRLNIELAQTADLVVFITAGLAQVLKGQAP